MLRLLRRIFSFGAKPGVTSSAHVRPMAQAQSSGTIEGAVARRTVSLNGLAMSRATKETARLVRDDGSAIEQEEQGYLIIGDGTVVTHLGGLSQCDLCASESGKLLAAGQIDGETAYARSLCRSSRIRRSALSGQALCPKHARQVETNGKLTTVSVLEAAAIEQDREIRRLLGALTGIFKAGEP